MGDRSVSDLECVKCHERQTQVIDSRGGPDGLSIRRRRKCLHCGYRFTTYETHEHPKVIATRLTMAKRAFEALQHAMRDVDYGADLRER